MWFTLLLVGLILGLKLFNEDLFKKALRQNIYGQYPSRSNAAEKVNGH